MVKKNEKIVRLDDWDVKKALLDVVMRSICADAESKLVPCIVCGCRKPKAKFGTEYDFCFYYGYAMIQCGGCGRLTRRNTMPDAVHEWNESNNIKEAE